MLVRKFKTSMVTFCMVIMLVFSPFVFSQSASDYFTTGVKAAESGNFRAALVQYRKAKEAGLNTAALKYNFAVVFYKLGQYEKAKKNFTELAQYPRFRRIAYFNLGLVANKQKDKPSAVRWFRRAYRGEVSSGTRSRKANDKEIKKLAAEALKRLGAPLHKKSYVSKAWKGYLSASIVSDSNVTRVNEDLPGVASQSDTSASLSAYGAKWLTGSASGGVRLFLSTYLQRYNTQSLYNYNRFSVGLARYDRLGGWRLRFGGTWDETVYGGSDYQSLLNAEIRGRRSLSKNNQLRLRYKITQVQAKNPAYNYLEGWRQQFRVASRIKSGMDQYRIYYQLELNDREDLNYFIVNVDDNNFNDEIFTSYSVTRHILRVTGWRKFSSSLTLRLDGRYRTSQYNDENYSNNGLTLVKTTERPREDTQTRASARLTKKFDRNWQIQFEYTSTNNKSSIDSESYSRSQFGFGIKRKF